MDLCAPSRHRSNTTDGLTSDIASKVSQVISLRFNKDSFWTRGHFPGTITNTTTGDVIKLTNLALVREHQCAFRSMYVTSPSLAIYG